MTQSQMIQTIHTIKNACLYIAFELSNSRWKLLFSNGYKRRQRAIDAGDIITLAVEIESARDKLGMGKDVPIYSCYEAGRDGFWLHRHLEEIGVTNLVVDASSIKVNRRYRRAKTDRIDVSDLMNNLIRYVGGESKIWSVVNVPSVEEEDARRINRERERLKNERTGHTNRIKSLLVLHGVRMKIGQNFLKELEEVRTPTGESLPPHTKTEIIREYERYQLIQEQMKALEQTQQEILESGSPSAQKVLALQNLKGLGPVSAWYLAYEFFWRSFSNTKEVGGAAGLVPTPYNSGDSVIEQGISKSGNKRIRWLMVELAWSWLRYQPESELSLWFMEHYGNGGKRMRRIGIVAVARKLLVALWRYVEKGVVPEGAVLKTPN